MVEKAVSGLKNPPTIMTCTLNYLPNEIIVDRQRQSVLCYRISNFGLGVSYESKQQNSTRK